MYNESLLLELHRELNHVRWNITALGLPLETELIIVTSVRTALAEIDAVMMYNNAVNEDFKR